MSDTRTPAKKAMDYIESLGIHTVYDQCTRARNDLDLVLTKLGEARDNRRHLEAQKVDREMEVVSDESGKHPDHSVAALERHVKIVQHSDPALQNIRSALIGVADDIDGLELDRSILETDIKIAIARLNELGGLLQFMAVVKSASETSKPSKPSETTDPDDPWRTTT